MEDYLHLAQRTYQTLIDSEVIPLFLEALNKRNSEGQNASFRGLMCFRDKASSLIPILVDHLSRATLPAFNRLVMSYELWNINPPARVWGEIAAFTEMEKQLFVPAIKGLIVPNSRDIEDFFAAFILAMFTGEDTPDEAVEILQKLITYPEEFGKAAHHYIHLATMGITQLRMDRAIQVLTSLLSQLEYVDDIHEIAFALLEKVFLNKRRRYVDGIRSYYSSIEDVLKGLTPAKLVKIKIREQYKLKGLLYPRAEVEYHSKTLTDYQRQILQVIVKNDLVWEYPSNLLELYGLPAERSKVRALLEG